MKRDPGSTCQSILWLRTRWRHSLIAARNAGVWTRESRDTHPVLVLFSSFNSDKEIDSGRRNLVERLIMLPEIGHRIWTHVTLQQTR